MSDSESKEELAMVELRVTVAYQTKKLDELRARIRELEAEASRHRDALAKITRQCAEFESQISAHEKVCAGVWVPCSERLPEDWWIGQVRYPDYSDGMITCRELEAQYTSARGFRFTSGTLAVISSSVAEWLDAKQPDEGAQS